jgi:hypothetical protein
VSSSSTAAAPAPSAAPTATEPANDSQPPQLLGKLGFNFGSLPADALITPITDEHRPYIVGGLPTPQDAKTLTDGHIGNIFNPEWQKLVAGFVQQNGGLGNSKDGYLAFSSEYGFVRLRNTNLTPEQNRRLAEMSLTMGIPIERMPSRTSDSAYEKPEINDWVNGFISKFDKQLAGFVANPSQGLHLKDGKLRINLDVDPKSGYVATVQYKKAGGLRGFLQKAMKYVSPIADIVSLIPGVGIVGIAVAQAIKYGGAMLAAGKGTVSGFVGALSGVVTGLAGGLGFSPTQIAAGEGVLRAGASAVDTGKFSFADLAQSVGPSLLGVGGDAKLYQQGLNALGKALDGGKFNAGDLIGLLEPLAQSAGITAPDASGSSNGVPAWAKKITDALGISIDGNDFQILKGLGQGIFKAIKDGKLSAGAVAEAMGGLVPSLTNDKQDQALIRGLLVGLAKSIDGHKLTLDQLLASIAASLKQAQKEISKTPQTV